jgi:GAF domain-containing protein/sensor histidine kinase YesM
MTNLILPTLYIVLAIVQLLLAVFAYLANRRSTSNILAAIFLLLFGLSNIGIGSQYTALTLNDAEPWYWIRLATSYMIAPSILLLTLIVLRPNWIQQKAPWISWILGSIILFAPIAILLDITGVSERLFVQPLFYVKPDPLFFTPGPTNVNNFSGGWLSPIFFSMQIWFPVSSLIITFFVALYDRKRNPQISRFAWILFVSLMLPSIAQGGFIGQTPPAILLVIANLIFSLGFAFGSIKLGDENFTIGRIPKIVSNWRMAYKLLFAVLSVILPIVLAGSVISLSFVQGNLIDIVGKSMSAIAEQEANQVSSELEIQIEKLRTLSQNSMVVELALQRKNRYDTLSSQQIVNEREANEVSWDSNNLSTIIGVNTIYQVGFLDGFIDSYPEFVELVLTDSQGMLIGATYRTSDYVFNQQEWWQSAINTNIGQAHIGSINFNQELSQYTLNIAIPVFEPDTDARIGVLLSTYSLKDLNNSLGNVKIGERGGTALFDANGDWVNVERRILQKRTPLNWIYLLEREETWAITPFDGIDSVVSYAEVPAIAGGTTSGWRVVAYEPKDDALALLNQTQWALFAASLVTLIFSLLMTNIISRFITPPLLELTQAAERFISGETEIQIPVRGQDEIGLLASTFNRLTKQLNELITGLETTIRERTQALERRARQMETSALVAREAASIHDTRQLLTSMTHLISERFGFYHAGVFLLDEVKEYAVLEAANSAGGQKMLARGHKLQVGKVGVVGYAAGMGEPRIAQDVGADVVYYNNPDMPETRSEMALPLKLRDQVIGVLDVQSSEPNAFTQEDVEVIQILADQLALAIDNARLLESGQSALRELEYLYGERVGQAWRRKLEQDSISYELSPTGLAKSSMGMKKPTRLMSDNSIVRRALTFRDQTLGYLELIRGEEDSTWSSEEISLIDDVIEQTSLALENARLVEQTQLRSDQIQLLQEVTSLAASHLDPNLLVNSVANQLVEGFNVDRCGIMLFDEAMEYGIIFADSDTMGETTRGNLGMKIPVEGNDVVLEVIRTQKSIVLYDIQTNSSMPSMVIEELKDRNIHTLVVAPLITRGKLMGTISLYISDPERIIDSDDLALLDQINAQVAGALDVAYLFRAEQEGRQATTALLEISQIANSSLDLSQVLIEITQRAAQATRANRCSIYTLDENKGRLQPLMSQFADGRKDVELWKQFKESTNYPISDIPIIFDTINKRKPIRLSRQSDGPFTETWMEPFNIHKLIMVPLVSQDKTVGLMTQDHSDPDFEFTDAQVDLAQTIASVIATTIENANLFSQAVRRAERERRVTEITAKVRASNNPQEILQTAVHELRKALGAKKAQILMPDKKNKADR